MLFDPIFQRLAIAMMFSAVSATDLTLVAVPLFYQAIHECCGFGIFREIILFTI